MGNKTGSSDQGLEWKYSLTVWSANGWTNAAWHKENAEMLPNVQEKSGRQVSDVHEVSSGAIIAFNWDDFALLFLFTDCNLR